tara:strand:+ start:8385 stop:8882 length:498 start_codon:yes stop_codon:yes gene_type:complete
MVARVKYDSELSVAGFCERVSKGDLDMSIILDHVLLSHEEVLDLCNLFIQGAPIHSLSVAECGIDDAGAVLIANAIRSSAFLRRLDLSGNQISSVGAVALADAILDSVSVSSVRIGSNKIGARGRDAFAKVEHASPELELLGLHPVSWVESVSRTGSAEIESKLG